MCNTELQYRIFFIDFVLLTYFPSQSIFFRYTLMRNSLSKFQSIRCGRAATLIKTIFQIHLKETFLGLQ